MTFDEKPIDEREPVLPRAAAPDRRIGLIGQAARVIDAGEHPEQLVRQRRQAHEADVIDALYNRVFEHASHPSVRTAVLLHLQTQVNRRREAALAHQAAVYALDRARDDFAVADARIEAAVATLREWDET